MDFHPAFEPYKIKRKICKYVLLILLVIGSFIVILQFIKSSHNSVLVKLPCESKDNPKNPVYSPIKVLVVADFSMSQYHGEHLKNYLYLLFKLAALEYRDESLGHSLHVEATRFITLDEEATSLLTEDTEIPSISQISSPSEVDADNLVKKFCYWQNLFKLRTGLDYHVAIHLTKHKLVHNFIPELDDTGAGVNFTSFHPEILGLANDFGVACDPTKSCAIVHDFNLETSSTIAHEIGHLLGMHNDESEECEDFKMNETIDDTKGESFIMGYASHSLHVFGSKWSNCSRFSLDHFLKSNESRCIYNRNENKTKKYKSADEGEVSAERGKNLDSIDADKLCNFFLSPYFYSADLNISIHASKCPGILNCSQVSCLQGPDLGCITFLTLAWADRTTCEENFKNESEPFTVDSHWCMNGECIIKPKT